MSTKEPVLLTVLIETAELRWYVAGIGLGGDSLPLICSEPGNLSPYVGAPFDEQVSFLRHRLSGVLQRGCDRLWGLEKKPCQIVFVADGRFAHAEPELTERVAEHFVTWMTKPPVAFFTCHPYGFGTALPLELFQVAGEMEPTHRQALERGLPALVAVLPNEQAWELAPAKKPAAC